MRGDSQRSKIRLASTEDTSPSVARSTFKVGSVQEQLTLLSARLMERFKKIHHAFRYFDVKSSGFISLEDFAFALDQLSWKHTKQQAADLFKRLDLDGDGFLSYQDFCELSEEKVRDIDPFDQIIHQVKER